MLIFTERGAEPLPSAIVLAATERGGLQRVFHNTAATPVKQRMVSDRVEVATR